MFHRAWWDRRGLSANGVFTRLWLVRCPHRRYLRNLLCLCCAGWRRQPRRMLMAMVQTPCVMLALATTSLEPGGVLTRLWLVSCLQRRYCICTCNNNSGTHWGAHSSVACELQDVLHHRYLRDFMSLLCRVAAPTNKIAHGHCADTLCDVCTYNNIALI